MDLLTFDVENKVAVALGQYADMKLKQIRNCFSFLSFPFDSFDSFFFSLFFLFLSDEEERIDQLPPPLTNPSQSYSSPSIVHPAPSFSQNPTHPISTIPPRFASAESIISRKNLPQPPQQNPQLPQVHIRNLLIVVFVCLFRCIDKLALIGRKQRRSLETTSKTVAVTFCAKYGEFWQYSTTRKKATNRLSSPPYTNAKGSTG